MSLQRKKVTVRTKRGKVYTRSVLVKSTPNTYLSPTKFYKRHAAQFGAMFAVGALQGASTYGAGRAVGARRGKIAGALSGYAAYKGSEHAGLKIWDHSRLGKGWKHAQDDMERLAPHTRKAVTRVLHATGYAGNAVGFAGAWGAHTLARRLRK